MGDFNSAVKELDTEFLLQELGFEYQYSSSAKGLQLNVEECPSCGNTRSKVYINAETGLGNCFVCEEKFNKFSLTKAATGLTNKETVNLIKTMAAQQGWRPKEKKSKTEVIENFDLPDSFALPTQEGQNLNYLLERGITNDTTKYFNLRYCDSAKWNGQDFSNRIIIPVYDLDSNLVSFQGRDITGNAERKYLFPAKLASTGRFLYNGHNALYAKEIAIGEGAFDVMAMHQAFKTDFDTSFCVAVGSFGKSLTFNNPDGDQGSELARIAANGLLRTVTFMWDSESSATDMAYKLAPFVKSISSDITVKIAMLPEGCDPNEVEPSVVVEAYKNAKKIDRKDSVRKKILSKLSL